MANSYVDFLTPTTAQQEFDNLTLDYVSTNDFYLTITNGETKTTYNASDSPAKITVSTSPTLKVTITDSAVYNTIVGTSTVRIGRTTDVASPERTFTDGSTLKASDLNTSFKQVLFGIQEQVDGGLGSIPTDTDGKLDAGGKVIKNVGATTNANDAATKDYVDNVILVGAGDPQNWSFNLNDGGWTTSGNDLTRTLTDPVPTSANDNLYLVEVGGVLQDPDDAYSVTESSGTYTLKLMDAQSNLGANVTVNLRNWGVTRNELLIPFKQETDAADSHALEVKNRSSDAAGDLVRFLDHDDTTLGKITKAGKLEIPEVSSKEGDLKVTSSVAVRNSADDGDLFKVDQTAGSTTVDGPATFNKACTFLDVLNITGSLKKNGANIMGLKAVVDRTSTSTSTDALSGSWQFIDRRLQLVKETVNYSEGDYLIMTYNIPVWMNDHNEASLMNMVLNTGSSTVTAGAAWTETESEVLFGSSNMVTKVLGNDTYKVSNTRGINSTSYYSNHGHTGTVVYQISAEDAAKAELTFDIIMVKYNGSPTLYTAYGSIFTGFLVG